MTAKYRDQLPQLSGDFFITDGGIETTLIYRQGRTLPSFAAFDLLKTSDGQAALQIYFSSYAALAKQYKNGLILESATWRANPDWAAKLGYSDADLDKANRAAITLLQGIRAEYETPDTPLVISGCVGPRGDGYQPDQFMTAEDAEEYHQTQIRTFAESDVDLISAITMNYVEEAIGIVWAAGTARVPAVISFTLETNGKLPTGQTLKEAITEVDEATDNAVAYYMINCAHPTHLASSVNPSEPWANRIRGIRVNASHKSHAELNQATALDEGNPAELAQQCIDLKNRWPQLNILGGCCGTDERHIEEICKARLALEVHG